jgi:hypothetical protein
LVTYRGASAIVRHIKRKSVLKFSWEYIIQMYGTDSSVGIATDYGLDGSGSNPGGDEIFRLSRPALGHIQLPVKWVPGLFLG